MENEANKEQMAQQESDSRSVHIPVRADLTFRDDQHDFYWMLDALRISKRRKDNRFRLVDSGVFDINQLEDLVSAGADLYTSDVERKSSTELTILLKAARKSGAIVAFFIQGDLPEEEPENLNLASLSLLGKDGLIIHVSNREKERKITDMILMASQCRLGSGRFVYYHHGPLSQELIALGREGVWIHVSDKSLPSEQDALLFLDIVSSSQTEGATGVLHVERDMAPEILADALEAGAFVLFKTLPHDFKSPLRPVEDEARKKRLDFRAFYLSLSILP